MSRILIFAADIPAYGDSPISGGGMRLAQLSHILESAGHEVLVSCPLTSFLARSFPERLSPELRKNSFSLRPQVEIFSELQPDLVIFASSWTTWQGDWWPSTPVVLDLCGPLLLENSHLGGADPIRLQAVFQRKLRALARADFLLCGGERQRYYFSLALALAGYSLLSPPPLGVLPMGSNPAWRRPLDELQASSPEATTFVYAGGLYPWQDPSLAIETTIKVLEERKQGRLLWIGGSHALTSRDRELDAQLKSRLESSERASLSPYLGIESLNRALREAQVSLDLMAPNPERALAVPTRTPHYLGLGLPPILGADTELADSIREAEAGWALAPNDKEALRALIHSILDSPEELLARRRAAIALAESQHCWSRQGKELLKFAERPQRRVGKASGELQEDAPILTRGEAWLVRLSRSPWLAVLRAALAPFFRKK